MTAEFFRRREPGSTAPTPTAAGARTAGRAKDDRLHASQVLAQFLDGVEQDVARCGAQAAAGAAEPGMSRQTVRTLTKVRMLAGHEQS